MKCLRQGQNVALAIELGLESGTLFHQDSAMLNFSKSSTKLKQLYLEQPLIYHFIAIVVSSTCSIVNLSKLNAHRFSYVYLSYFKI